VAGWGPGQGLLSQEARPTRVRVLFVVLSCMLNSYGRVVPRSTVAAACGKKQKNTKSEKAEQTQTDTKEGAKTPDATRTDTARGVFAVQLFKKPLQNSGSGPGPTTRCDIVSHMVHEAHSGCVLQHMLSLTCLDGSLAANYRQNATENNQKLKLKS